MSSPFTHPDPRSRGEDTFASEEVRLANRNHGLALELMRHDITPTGMHYLLTHFDIPHLSIEKFGLSVSGEVERAIDLSYQDIISRRHCELAVTLECAGNGRAVYEDRSRSMPWHHEAVGTSVWSGTPLVDVLEEAGLMSSAKEVVFIGADRGFDKGVEHNFGRSLSLEMAKNPDVLLVTGMNGAPLLPQHGAPLRLIVPGWYGMASVKWLNRIEVWDRPYDGFQQVEGYQFRTSDEEAGTGVQSLRVKSLMVPPGIPDWYSRQRLVDAGDINITGRAWSGNGVRIQRVEFSQDGEAWADAKLSAPIGTYAWREWNCGWKASAGTYTLRCRATDADGNIQPLEPPWDVAGFGNNAAQSVPVTVRSA